MTKVPLPWYDLVRLREYAMGCIQTSRGSPFQCEFCDIIVIFGRKPRIKTPEQVIAEIDAVDAEAVCSLADTLLAPARLSAAGIGPSEERFLAALEGIAPGLAEAA